MANVPKKRFDNKGEGSVGEGVVRRGTMKKRDEVCKSLRALHGKLSLERFVGRGGRALQTLSINLNRERSPGFMKEIWGYS